MNTHHILQAIKERLCPSTPKKTVQTEFDFASPKTTPPAPIRLNLAERNVEHLLDLITRALGSGATALHLELIGPGIMLHDHALMLFDELMTRPASMTLHVISRTCLADGAILLWLAGDTRSIRHDAWIQLSPMPPLPSIAGDEGHGTAVHITEEEPGTTDLRRIMDYLDEWLPVHEVTGLRLFKADLEDLGLLEDADSRRQLNALLAGELSPNAGTVHANPPTCDTPQLLPPTADKVTKGRGG